MAKHQDGRQPLPKHCTQEWLTSNRDQELRFIVQDSPDYYKLKCSIFNDDKKTDLIGEVWIDLQTVVVPGGGQNDLWHQLNFKGKYAGDIRIELTFYDSRPKPDTLSEKRKQREKSHSTASDLTTSSTAGARQLGPRDIKRRPLPPGPGGILHLHLHSIRQNSALYLQCRRTWNRTPGSIDNKTIITLHPDHQSNPSCPKLLMTLVMILLRTILESNMNQCLRQ